MGRKKKIEPPHLFVIQWDSISGDGWRVKHRMCRSDKHPDAFWHIETRLTDDPVTLSQGLHCAYEVYPRQFFGKVWIAQRIEYKRASTWKAIGEAVRQLEAKEAQDKIKKRKKEK